MSSISGFVTDRRILVTVLIGPFRAYGDGPPDVQPFCGLVDTGATSTCISRSIVERFGLVPRSRRPVTTIIGTTRLPVHFVHVGFETTHDRHGAAMRGIQILDQPVAASEMPHNNSFDVLIGMDALTQCEFTVHRAGRFEMRF